MTRLELAALLCRAVQARRLHRIGEVVPPEQEFTTLSPEDQQPWLDVAEAVLDLVRRTPLTTRLRELADDWDRYTGLLARDPAWRDEMRRAIVIEMRVTVERLWEEADRG